MNQIIHLIIPVVDVGGNFNIQYYFRIKILRATKNRRKHC